MFKTKEIKTYTLGDKLKDVRESMKMPLWQASKKTNIPLNYLEHLEQGNYEELPADIYVVAYLKKYAEILNLNIEEILELFKAERGIIADSPKSSKKNRKGVVITPKRLTLVLVIIGIALIFGYFWHQLSYLINPPNIKITQPVSDLTTNQRFIEVSGQTESDVHLTINGKEIYVDSRGYFRSAIDLELGLNILKIEAKDRFGKTSTVIRKVMVIR